jgi:hypothetical protein
LILLEVQENAMANAKALDMEASIGERPQRPDVMAAGVPNSPVLPDVPDTPGDKRALVNEQCKAASADGTPPGGLPDGIPHGDRNPGAKPHQGR